VFDGVYDNHLFRHATCQSIKTKSMEPIHCLKKPRRVTVFFNPAACNGKSSRLFKKNAEPVLHLSGCDVKVVRLEYEGEAKQLMSVIEDVDMIVAAGGDGTVNEIVTGLLRRPDAKRFQHLPIGVIPLGRTNTISQILCDEADETKQAQWIVKAVSDLFTGKCRQMDVMKIESENGKTAFALTDIRWGSYRDAQSRMHKYWIFGSLRNYASHFFASLKSATYESRKFDISYNTALPVLETAESNDIPVGSKPHTFTSLPTMTKLFSWFIPSADSQPKSLVDAESSSSSKSKAVGEQSVPSHLEVEYDKQNNDEQSMEFIASGSSSSCIHRLPNRSGFIL
jgi:acylglycerol kinase